MRVAVFSDSALPVLNGVSISVDALVTELRALGHSVHLYTARFPSYDDPDPNTYRFRSMIMPWMKGYPVAYPPYYRMLKKFRRYEYDIIHTHTPWVLGFVGMRWAESHGIPIVSTYHTLYDRYSHYLPFLPNRYMRFRIAKHTNFYYNLADHVITPSLIAQRWLRRHSVATDITVIPTGVPGRRMLDRAEQRRELGVSPEQRLMIYVGRLAKEKNLELVLDSAANVIRRDPHAILWLVGDGPYRTECLQHIRKLGIGDRTRLVGFVSRSEVDRYYAAADLFLFPSVTETQGLVVTEAMSYGLPTVVAAGGGAGESVVDGKNGFLVANDATPFTEAIRLVFSDENLYARLSEGALTTAREQGTGPMAQRVVNVYEQVLDRRHASQWRASVV